AMPAVKSSWICPRRLKLASTWLEVTSPAHHAEVSKKPLATSAAMANGTHTAEPFSPRMSSLHTHAAAARMELVTSLAINWVYRVPELISTPLQPGSSPMGSGKGTESALSGPAAR